MCSYVCDLYTIDLIYYVIGYHMFEYIEVLKMGSLYVNALLKYITHRIIKSLLWSSVKNE